MRPIGKKIPNVVFNYRVRTDGHPITFVNTENGDENPFTWQKISSKEMFQNKKVLVFSLPGAFTPTCSTYQVPGFEELYDEFIKLGIDEIYVISVNDTFVMRKWMIDQNIQKLKFIPDGNGDFTIGMKMLVNKSNVGMAWRSWRYAMLVNNLTIENYWIEEGKGDNIEEDPYEVTDPHKILEELKELQ